MACYRDREKELGSEESYEEYAGWEPDNAEVAEEWEDYFNSEEGREPWDAEKEIKYYEEQIREGYEFNLRMDNIHRREEEKRQAETNKCNALVLFETRNRRGADMQSLILVNPDMSMQAEEEVEKQLAVAAAKRAEAEEVKKETKEKKIRRAALK